MQRNIYNIIMFISSLNKIRVMRNKLQQITLHSSEVS